MANIRDIVNSKYTVVQAYELVTGRIPPQGKCYCPIHSNKNTPAAKIYGSKLVCFGVCSRSFDSFDLIRRLRPDVIEDLKGSGVYEDVKKEIKRKVKYKSMEGLSLENIIKLWINEPEEVNQV